MDLICVVDPMCSWCYGFGRPLGELRAAPPESLAPLGVSLVMGGLRPYTREPMPAGQAAEIAHHWRRVHEASGQPFAPPGATALERPGFVYDTEPASRAVVTVRTHWPERTFAYFEAVQRAFYLDAQDVTGIEALSDLAAAQDLPRADFDAAFDSDAMRDATRQDFAQAQAWGIRGFPALIARHGGQLHLVANGYTPLADLTARLTALAARA